MKKMSKKELIKNISKVITNLTISLYLSGKFEEVLLKYFKGAPLKVLVILFSSIASWTASDVVSYLVEQAYNSGELTLCEAAGILEEIRSKK